MPASSSCLHALRSDVSLGSSVGGALLGVVAALPALLVIVKGWTRCGRSSVTWQVDGAVRGSIVPVDTCPLGNEARNLIRITLELLHFCNTIEPCKSRNSPTSSGSSRLLSPWWMTSPVGLSAAGWIGDIPSFPAAATLSIERPFLSTACESEIKSWTCGNSDGSDEPRRCDTGAARKPGIKTTLKNVAKMKASFPGMMSDVTKELKIILW